MFYTYFYIYLYYQFNIPRGVYGLILAVFTSSGVVFRSILYNITIREYFDLFYFFDFYDVL